MLLIKECKLYVANISYEMLNLEILFIHWTYWQENVEIFHANICPTLAKSKYCNVGAIMHADITNIDHAITKI